MLRKPDSSGPSSTHAVRSPQYNLVNLAALDDRIDAHLDGLRIAGDYGWEICKKCLEEGGAGDVFTAAVFAFESGRDERTRLVLEKGTTAPPASAPLVSALGWLPYERQNGPCVAGWIRADSAALCERRRVRCPPPPSCVLPATRASAAIPGLMPVSTAPLANSAHATPAMPFVKAWSTRTSCRFWAAWSGMLSTTNKRPSRASKP